MATIITYSFIIGNDTIPYSASAEITIDKVKYDASLLSLRYHKKMFQPGKIEAKLQLKQKTNELKKAPEISKLVSYFKTQKNNVSLSKTVNDVKKEIAKNYYVYKVVPEYKRDKDGQYVNVTLHIYSPDHKLTLDKYCRSYVNQKLVGDIMNDELNNGILAKAGFTKDTFDGSMTHYLNYIHSITGNSVEMREFLQPYLVQYDESFYDFIARTANRCGEFFYYEDGKLYLGLNDFEEQDDKQSGARIDINKDEALSIVYEEADDSLVSTKGIRVDSLNKQQFGTYTDSDYACPEKVSYDDFIDDFFSKDQWTSFTEELFPLKIKYIPAVLSALFTGGILGAVNFVASVFIPGLAFAGPTANAKNKFMNELWVVNADKGKGKQRHATEQYDSSKEKAALYGSMLTDDVKKNNYDYALNLNQRFYTFIHEGCKEVGRNLIRVNIGTQQVPFMLGQKVTFESQAENESQTFAKYIILEVNDVIKAEESNSGDGWAPGQKVVLLPLYTVESKKFSSSTQEKINLPIPPMVHPFVRTSSIQRAYVAQSNDPSSYGRVCIRYPWQKKDADSSPWIRVATPYAPSQTEDNGGGMAFQHCEGDEVLVDYEGGNIERPYVIGSLFNSSVKAPGSGLPFSDWSPSNHPEQPRNLLTIASRKGHKLTFDDNGNAEDFMRSCLPGLDLIKPLTNSIFDSLRFDQGMNSCFSGGVKLGDKWGVYSIACSTTDRSIDIKSPFGTVNLNAFTGITINAPCGDVKISGKNVTIEAGNELKLLSGTNIQEDTSIMRDMVLKGIFTSLIDKTVAKLVDLTLVRTVTEILLKPVAGTMTLKSKRYMLIMAGKGSAEIPNRAYSYKGLLNKDSVGGSKLIFNGSSKPWKWQLMNDRIFLGNTLRLINEQVTEWHEQLAVMYDLVKKKAKSLAEDPKQTNKDSKTLIDLAYTKMNTPFKEADFNFTLEAATANDKLQVIEKGNELAMALQIIVNYCKDIKDGKKFPKDKNEYRTYYKKTIEVIKSNDFGKHLKDIIDGNETYEKTIEEVKALGTPLKRMIAYKIIEDTYVVEQVPKSGNLPIKFSTLKDYQSDVAWLQYVASIRNFKGRSVKGAQGAALRFGMEVVDYFKEQMDNKFALAKMYSESGIWSSAQTGEILFSDKSGSETLNFQNGGLNHTPNEDGYEGLVRGELAAF